MMKTSSGRVIVWGETVTGNLLFAELCVFDSYPGAIALLANSKGESIKIELPKEIQQSDTAGKIMNQSFRILV